MKILIRSFIFFASFLLNLSFECLSQVASNMKIEYNDTTVVITYDLSKKADVYLEVYEADKKFTQFIATGDVGLNISGGNSKKIFFKPFDEIFSCFNCIYRLIVNPSSNESFIDPRDNTEYAIKRIAGRIWMTENMNFNSGTGSEKGKYGYYYTWDAAMSVCPFGWSLPSKYEWEKMISYFGGADAAGKNLKSKESWLGWYTSTDLGGFNALASGFKNENKKTQDVGEIGSWWTSDSESNISAVSFFLLNSSDGAFFNNSSLKNTLRAVRCIKN